MNKKELLKAGHYEIQGETIAKFEFFENGFNPYSRYLDVDKVDLILRRREEKNIRYFEVQVKYGRLYDCSEKWSKKLFDVTSWKMFRIDEFKDHRPSLYIALVLAHPDGYKGDIFVFPSEYFDSLIRKGIHTNSKKGKRTKVYIARSLANSKWYLWKKWKFDDVNTETAEDVTEFRRNFDLTGAELK